MRGKLKKPIEVDPHEKYTSREARRITGMNEKELIRQVATARDTRRIPLTGEILITGTTLVRLLTKMGVRWKEPLDEELA